MNLRQKIRSGKIVIEKKERKSDVRKCEDCGHSMREHLRDFNGRVNCQVCERKGLTCN